MSNQKIETGVVLSGYKVLRLVSYGGYGRIFLVEDKEGNYFAMKTAVECKTRPGLNLCMDSISIEFDVFCAIPQGAPFFPQFIEYINDEKGTHLVMEYIPGGSFGNFLEEVRRLSENDAKFYIAELVLALETLNNSGFIHGDVKPDNVLIDSDGHIALVDFGFSKRKNCTALRGGTPEYQAPEGDGRYLANVTATDFWSVGIFLWECLTLLRPTQRVLNAMERRRRMNDEAFLQANRRLRHYRPSPACDRLLQVLLCRDPARRLSNYAEMKAHPWFSSVDWDALASKDLFPPYVPYLAENGSDTIKYRRV